jgi:hypothetical protein
MNKMPKIGNWKKLKENSETVVWNNEYNDETIYIKRYYPMAREYIMFGSEGNDPNKNWWESNIYSGLVPTKRDAKEQAIDYMKAYPNGRRMKW